MYLVLKWLAAVNKFNLYSNFRTLFRQGSFFISTFLVWSIITASESVSNIKIIGNNHTKSSIILREVYHPIPEKFDTLLSQQDRNRIYNLNIFSKVAIYSKDSTYTIIVNESPPYYPIPLMDYNEAKGWSYGLGIKTDNFRGQNESIIGGAMLGEDPVYFLYYSNPWVWGDHIGITIDLLNVHSEHHVYDSLIYKKELYVGSGFQYHNYHNISGSIGLAQRSIESVSKIIPSYQFNHFISQFSYAYDSRDIKVDPTMGNLSGIDFSSNWGSRTAPNYSLIELFSQFYFSPIKSKISPTFSYTIKSLFQFTDSYLPYYQHKYLGGEDYVRGYSPTPDDNVKFEKYIEVDQLIYQSIQTQFTIFPRIDKSGIEMGLDGLFFLDIGVGSDLKSQFKLENTIYGFGFGFRLFMSGFGYIGFDFGFNPSGGFHTHLSDSN